VEFVDPSPCHGEVFFCRLLKVRAPLRLARITSFLPFLGRGRGLFLRDAVLFPCRGPEDLVSLHVFFRPVGRSPPLLSDDFLSPLFCGRMLKGKRFGSDQVNVSSPLCGKVDRDCRRSRLFLRMQRSQRLLSFLRAPFPLCIRFLSRSCFLKSTPPLRRRSAADPRHTVLLADPRGSLLVAVS